MDPFYESQENHNLIGVANVFLEVLFHDVKLDYHVPIISQQGEVSGTTPSEQGSEQPSEQGSSNWFERAWQLIAHLIKMSGDNRSFKSYVLNF